MQTIISLLTITKFYLLLDTYTIVTYYQWLIACNFELSCTNNANLFGKCLNINFKLLKVRLP